MVLPIALLFLVFATLVGVLWKRPRLNRVTFLLALAGLAVIAGLRNEFGLDFLSYNQIFAQLPPVVELMTSLRQYSAEIHGEFGFLLLGSIVKDVFASFQLLLFLMAVASVAILGLALNKMSPFPILSLLLYFPHAFLIREMGQIRAGLAIALYLFGLQFLKNKPKFNADDRNSLDRFAVAKASLNYFFCAFLASSFHSVAFLAFPAYFFLRRQLSSATILVLIFSAIAVYETQITVMVLDRIGSFLPRQAAVYLADTVFSYDLGLLNFVTLKQVFLVTMMACYRRVLREKNRYFEVLYNSYVLGTAWIIGFSAFAVLAGRVATLFSVVELILVPILVSAIRPRALAVFFCIAYATTVFAANVYFRHNGAFSHYRWLFDGG